MENEFRFKGLVLRNLPFGERENILTVLSAGYGRKTVRCYGARKPSGHIMPAVQPFCYSDFLVYEKNGKWILREVQYLENFYELRSDVLSLSCAVYMLDLINECTRENENAEMQLRVTLNCLFALTRKIAPPEIVKTVFEIALLSAEGYAADCASCASCGQPLSDPCFFYPQDGGFLCASCADLLPPDASFRRADRSLRRALAHIQQADIKRLFSFRIGKKCLSDLSRLSEERALGYFEHSFESLNYYKSMKETSADD